MPRIFAHARSLLAATIMIGAFSVAPTANLDAAYHHRVKTAEPTTNLVIDPSTAGAYATPASVSEPTTAKPTRSYKRSRAYYRKAYRQKVYAQRQARKQAIARKEAAKKLKLAEEKKIAVEKKAAMIPLPKARPDKAPPRPEIFIADAETDAMPCAPFVKDQERVAETLKPPVDWNASYKVASLGGDVILGRGAAISWNPESIDWGDIAKLDAKGPIQLPDELQATVPKEKPPEEVIREAREYLIRTALVGDTMRRQTPEVAIGRLHPVLVVRLHRAIKEMRDLGYKAGVFSAYRPPAFGIGGFRGGVAGKFNSLHAYGLAVDMYGIGSAGSASARLFWKIAAKHGVYGVYGSRDRAEWNHYQLVPFKVVTAKSELRTTITPKAPKVLEKMWAASKVALFAITPTSIAMAEPPPRRRWSRKGHRKHYGKHRYHRHYANHRRHRVASR